MGKLIFTVFAVFFTIFTNLAYAQEVNLLKNPGFESRTSQWAKTGSSAFTLETASPLAGIYSAKWDASATGEFFRSSTYTIPSGLKGTTCLIEMKYLWDSGTAGHILMNVDDGTNNIATLSLSPTSGGVPRKAQLNFSCPTSGTLRFELESTANAAQITLDEMYLGSGKNSVSISQAELYGAVSINSGTVNCSMSTSSGATADFPTDSDCTAGLSVQGNAIVVAGDFRLRVPALPPGRYEVIANLPFRAQAGAGTICEVYMSGTGGIGNIGYGQSAQQGASADANLAGYSLSGVFTKTSSLGQTDIYFQWRRTSGAGSCVLNFDVIGGPATVSLKRFPTQSAEALTLDTAGYFSEVRLAGANPSLVNANVTTRSSVGDSGLTMAILNGATDTWVPCAGNAPTGLTCSSGNEELGFVPNIPYAGDFEVCAEFPVEISMNGSGRYYQQWSWVETNLDGSAEIRVFPATTHGQDTTPAGSTGVSGEGVRFCNIINFSSAGRKRLMAKYTHQVVNTSALILLLDGNTTVSDRQAKFSIKPVTQQLPAPLLTEVKQKVSSTSINQRLERVSVRAACSSSPCSLDLVTSGITNVTRVGTGDYAINFVAGTFSVAPTCVGTAKSTSGIKILANVSSSTTQAFFQTYNRSDGTIVDDGFEVICMGTN